MRLSRDRGVAPFLAVTLMRVNVATKTVLGFSVLRITGLKYSGGKVIANSSRYFSFSISSLFLMITFRFFATPAK